MENSLERIKQELKSLKASMPVSSSLVETYIITQTFIKVLPNQQEYTYTITFTPYEDYRKIGINSFSLYKEEWASGPITSQYNPYSFGSVEGASQNADGSMSYSTSSTPYFYDGDTFELRITASVFGTIPGTLSIEWS